MTYDFSTRVGVRSWGSGATQPKLISDTYSGRALWGAGWLAELSSFAWSPGGGPHCSYWENAPLVLNMGLGSQI